MAGIDVHNQITVCGGVCVVQLAQLVPLLWPFGEATNADGVDAGERGGTASSGDATTPGCRCLACSMRCMHACLRTYACAVHVCARAFGERLAWMQIASQNCVTNWSPCCLSCVRGGPAEHPLTG